MYEHPEGQGADNGGDSGVGPGQTVPGKQRAGQGSDIAASLAKSTSPQVMPSTQFDHVQADDKDS